uniref:Tetraspanin n=1 Tax=Sphenodon punctatus TaxID=8508 RepID=A0A8D0HP02_SPHPU
MDCGVITSKTVLLLLSLIFWAAGAGLAYVGGYVISTYKNYDHFLQDKYALLPAVIIICVAVVMFIIGLVGCCGTIRESRVGLGIFLVIILMIFIAEVAAFVLGFIYKEKVKSDVQGTMQTVFQKYDGKSSETHIVDYLQQQLQCCGVSNYSDWTATQWFNSTGNDSVPLSCCKQDMNSTCTGRLSEPQYLNTQGCAEKVESGLQSVLSYAMLVILGFAIVKFFGMLSVCVLTCKREDNGYQPLYSGVFA